MKLYTVYWWRDHSKLSSYRHAFITPEVHGTYDHKFYRDHTVMHTITFFLPFWYTSLIKLFIHSIGQFRYFKIQLKTRHHHEDPVNSSEPRAEVYCSLLSLWLLRLYPEGTARRVRVFLWWGRCSISSSKEKNGVLFLWKVAPNKSHCFIIFYVYFLSDLISAGTNLYIICAII